MPVGCEGDLNVTGAVSPVAVTAVNSEKLCASLWAVLCVTPVVHGGSGGLLFDVLTWACAMIVGVSCLLCSSALPGVWSFLRVTQIQGTTSSCQTPLTHRN